MLGTRTTYSTEIRAAKPHSWRIPIIVVAVLVVIGAGGWWMVQNGQGTSTAAGPGNTAAVAADGLQATIGRAAPTVVGDTGTAATAQLGAAQADQPGHGAGCAAGCDLRGCRGQGGERLE